MRLLFQRHFGGEDRPIAGPAVRELISNALTGSGITDASRPERPAQFIFFRRRRRHLSRTRRAVKVAAR